MQDGTPAHRTHPRRRRDVNLICRCCQMVKHRPPETADHAAGSVNAVFLSRVPAGCRACDLLYPARVFRSMTAPQWNYTGFMGPPPFAAPFCPVCSPEFDSPAGACGARPTAEARMPSAVGHMSCLICAYQWEVEAILASDSAYVIPDDLCPECGAQGEPLDVSASPVATTRN